MKKIKILHFISSLKIGGAESLLYDQIVGLGFEQFEHELIYIHGGPNVARIESLGIPVFQIKGAFFPYDPLFLWRLWSEVRRRRPAVMHCALWAANFLGRCVGYAQKIPVLCVVHLGVDLDGKIRNLLDRPTFGLASHVVAVSPAVADSIALKGLLKKNFMGSHKLTTIQNGIDGAAIVARAEQAGKSRRAVGLPADAVVIGSVGRFVARKNFSLLLRSFAPLAKRYAHARLVLVGTGEQEGALRLLVNELGIVDYVLFVVGQSAYGYYPLFDIFVLSSLQEGLSIALLEAMSCKLPCVVTTKDESHELLMSNDNGMVIKSNDEKALTATLEKLLLEPHFRAFLGERARQTVDKEFRLDRMIDAYRNLFISLSES